MARDDCQWCCNVQELARNAETFKAAVLYILCDIFENTAASGAEAISSCLEVTVAGAWGSIGDRITETRFYDISTTPPTLISTLYYNENTQAAVTGITSANTDPCAGGDVATDGVHTQPSMLTATSTTIAPANAARQYLLIQNNSAANIMINLDAGVLTGIVPTATNLGLVLAPLGSYESTGQFIPRGAITGYQTSGGTINTVSVFEA